MKNLFKFLKFAFYVLHWTYSVSRCSNGEIIIANGTATTDTQCGFPNAFQSTTESTNISDVNSTDRNSSTPNVPSNRGNENFQRLICLVFDIWENPCWYSYLSHSSPHLSLCLIFKEWTFSICCQILVLISQSLAFAWNIAWWGKQLLVNFITPTNGNHKFWVKNLTIEYNLIL